MLIDINKITVKERIRKDYGDLDELAQDIKENGLINPPVVTPEFELIAGERRLKAMQLLGYQQVEVRVMKVNDYIHQLNLEISENESRKEFTKKERFEYTQKLIELKRLQSANLHTGESEIIEESSRESGVGSRRQYYKEKDIVENADDELLEQWDKGDISTHAAYQQILKERDELKAKLARVDAARNKTLEEREQLREEANKHQSNYITTTEILRESQGTVKMLQESLEKERQRTKDEQARLVKLLEEARAAGGDPEKVKVLEMQLNNAQKKVKELEEEMAKPVTLEPDIVEKVIEKVPAEVERELEQLRAKAGQPEAVLKCRIQVDDLINGFKDLLATLAELKDKDPESYEKYRGAVSKLVGRMQETL